MEHEGKAEILLRNHEEKIGQVLLDQNKEISLQRRPREEISVERRRSEISSQRHNEEISDHGCTPEVSFQSRRTEISFQSHSKELSPQRSIKEILPQECTPEISFQGRSFEISAQRLTGQTCVQKLSNTEISHQRTSPQVHRIAEIFSANADSNTEVTPVAQKDMEDNIVEERRKTTTATRSNFSIANILGMQAPTSVSFNNSVTLSQAARPSSATAMSTTSPVGLSFLLPAPSATMESSYSWSRPDFMDEINDDDNDDDEDDDVDNEDDTSDVNCIDDDMNDERRAQEHHKHTASQPPFWSLEDEQHLLFRRSSTTHTSDYPESSLHSRFCPPTPPLMLFNNGPTRALAAASQVPVTSSHLVAEIHPIVEPSRLIDAFTTKQMI
jgi:hypothetical protein